MYTGIGTLIVLNLNILKVYEYTFIFNNKYYLKNSSIGSDVNIDQINSEMCL